MEQQESNNIHQGKKKKAGDDAIEGKNDKDYKDFLDEIEEDPEMRQNINLYKVK